jgi:UPF0755 protein
MKKLTHIAITTASLAIFLAIGIVIWLMSVWYVFPITAVEDTVVFDVPPGISTTKLAHDLYQQQLIKSPQYFIWLARLTDNMTKIKTGQYEMTPGIKADELLENLVKGKVVLRKVTIIEGWTFQDLLNSLNENPYIKHELDDKTPDEIMTIIGHEGQNPEGRFYPETYLFAQGTSDTKILSMAYDLMHEKLTAGWQTRATDLPYETPEQALIIASMVEKEARLSQERPQVAGVILKRLQIGMRLQIDATVIYGRDGDYLKPLTRTDLQIDTPYNTYTRNGLPPGPISMPSQSSLQAVFHPVINNDIYYVAKGDGSHIFSTNLSAHNKAVREYREKQKKKY